MGSKTILMTGATGFMGSNLAKALLKEGHNIVILKRSFSNTFRIKEIAETIKSYDLDKTDIETCIREVRPQVVIHCATDYGRKNTDPSTVIEANLTLPLRLLEACRTYDVGCFINTDTYLDKGINYYSLSKKQFREWLETYSADLVCVNIILEHFYGPFDDKTKFVSYVINELRSNATQLDLTPGQQTRDFIYIDDVVAAFSAVISKAPKFGNGTYNFGIGTDTQISIRDLVELIRGTLRNTTTTLNFGAIPYRKNEVMSSSVDTAAIRALGWQPAYSVQDGLVKTIETENKHL